MYIMCDLLFTIIHLSNISDQKTLIRFLLQQRVFIRNIKHPAGSNLNKESLVNYIQAIVNFSFVQVSILWLLQWVGDVHANVALPFDLNNYRPMSK